MYFCAEALAALLQVAAKEALLQHAMGIQTLRLASQEPLAMLGAADIF
jgi:hypothetical protein